MPPEGSRRDRRTEWNRRRYLVATAGLAGLAGCTGAPTTGDEETPEPTPTEEDEDGEEHEELPPGVSAEEFERGPVPQEYRRAVSLGVEERNPDELNTKQAVQFSEYDEALENAAHQPGRCCANCADFIPDKNGDGFGACAEVEGYIDGADWCTIWEELPEPTVPDGVSADELATAEVPSGYLTASSQAGEARVPDELVPQADVAFGESIDQIADGVAEPGQSCGNCAEYIPDQNGDSWGACAKVEGYIAVEDWCSLWEAISEA